jgi:hypothetical protein
VIGLGQAITTNYDPLVWLTFMSGNELVLGSSTGPEVGYPEGRFGFSSGPPDIRLE